MGVVLSNTVELYGLSVVGILILKLCTLTIQIHLDFFVLSKYLLAVTARPCITETPLTPISGSTCPLTDLFSLFLFTDPTLSHSWSHPSPSHFSLSLSFSASSCSSFLSFSIFSCWRLLMGWCLAGSQTTVMSQQSVTQIFRILGVIMLAHRYRYLGYLM